MLCLVFRRRWAGRLGFGLRGTMLILLLLLGAIRRGRWSEFVCFSFLFCFVGDEVGVGSIGSLAIAVGYSWLVEIGGFRLWSLGFVIRGLVCWSCGRVGVVQSDVVFLVVRQLCWGVVHLEFHFKWTHLTRTFGGMGFTFLHLQKSHHDAFGCFSSINFSCGSINWH